MHFNFVLILNSAFKQTFDVQLSSPRFRIQFAAAILISLSSISSNEANKNTTCVPHREAYVKDDDTLYKAGDTMTNLKMARTFKAIAEGGRTAFYFGDLARDIVADIQEAGERG